MAWRWQLLNLDVIYGPTVLPGVVWSFQGLGLGQEFLAPAAESMMQTSHSSHYYRSSIGVEDSLLIDSMRHGLRGVIMLSVV